MKVWRSGSALKNVQYLVFITHRPFPLLMTGPLDFKMSYLQFIGMIVLVDFKASRLPMLATQEESSFGRALLVYTLCVIAGVVLMVLGTLCIFLVLMNAAYKVRKIPIVKKTVNVTYCDIYNWWYPNYGDFPRDRGV